jgi:hypothetical protein
VGDKWHFDEVALKIGGVNHWLWRAMDQAGVVLDVLVQRRRNKQAAKRMFSEVMCPRLFRGSRICPPFSAPPDRCRTVEAVELIVL